MEDGKTSFTEVIVKYNPVKRKLSDVLSNSGDYAVLAGNIENLYREIR